MSYYLYNAQVLEMGFSKKTLLVYHTLCRMANSKTRSCYPGKGKIAAAAGCSKKTVQRATKTLESAGLLRIEENFRKADGKQSSNCYYLLDHAADKANMPTGRSSMKRANQSDLDVNLHGCSLKVLLYIKSRMGKNQICSCRLHEIASKLRLSVRSVQRCLEELYRTGRLSIQTETGSRNVYCPVQSSIQAKNQNPIRITLQKSRTNAAASTLYTAIAGILRFRI